MIEEVYKNRQGFTFIFVIVIIKFKTKRGCFMDTQKQKKRSKHTISTIIIQKIFGSKSIKRQLYGTYFAALVVPIVILGIFLLTNTYQLLKNYHMDLAASDNLRVKAIFFEITTQIFNISENISGDDRASGLLGEKYLNEDVFCKRADEFMNSGSYIYNYAEIEELAIYTDNPSIVDYRIFHYADEDIRQTGWYEQAVDQASVFWVPLERYDQNGKNYWNLCLVRRIPLINTDYHAVLVIRISDNYLRTRVESSDYETVVGIDDELIVYSSDRERYGKPMDLPIDTTDIHYSYQGDMEIGRKIYIANVVTLNMYQSTSRLYICTLNAGAYKDIRNITKVCLLIIVAALVLPGAVFYIYIQYFANRVDTLRNEMHKASQGEYNIIPDFRGSDELSEAFADLQLMVEKIQEKDALTYQSQITEKELKNKQQEMEFKMLASQINPHFLYNTLETIRMNAFTAGNREVATSIKLLGKSLRYVLENTGTASTTLNRELEYIENYIKIQKLRFGDRINWKLEVDEGIELSNYRILPLLLQPIVENAIVHGLEQKEEGGVVIVHVYLQPEDQLHIDIIDNGCGMDAGQVQKLRNSIIVRNPYLKASIGLYNINQRIKLCYGSRYGLQISSAPGQGTTISLVIPANSESFLDEE